MPSCAASADQSRASIDYPLVNLAAKRFPALTRAERALLDYADVSNGERGEFAVAGISAIPLDQATIRAAPPNGPMTGISAPD
jgi:hypothetical protein